MKKLFTVVIALCASACVTTGSGVTTFKSKPDGATVTVTGYGECETPCTVQIINPVSVTVAKTGYTPQTFSVAPGKKTVDIVLELAAPTENVEETALPEL